jgi:hypothetical protein
MLFAAHATGHLERLAQQRLGLRVTRLHAQVVPQVAQGGERVGMLGAQQFAATRERGAIAVFRFRIAAQLLEQTAHVVERSQRVDIALAEHTLARLDREFLQRQRVLVAPQAHVQRRERLAQRRVDERLIRELLARRAPRATAGCGR